MSITAYIALGSNLGDSVELIRTAVQRLQPLSAAPVQCSSLWRSPPVDCPPGSPDFVNAVAGIVPLPNETPETLLGKLQALEREFGRRPKKVLNEARPLDLDLIAWASEIRSTPALTLPHPRAHLRRFVLEPLAEIAHGYVFPDRQQTVRELLATIPEDPEFQRIA